MGQRHILHIHAIEAKDDIGNGHQNGDDGEHFHDNIQIVGDHRSKGIHGAAEDAGIDIGHFNGLFKFDDHIFQQILILFIKLEDPAAEQLFQRGFCGFQRSGKINQGLFQCKQLDQFFVFQGFIQLPFDLARNLFNLAQMEQIFSRRPQHQVECKAGLHGGIHIFHQSPGKIPHHRGFLQRDGDHILFCDQNGQGQSGEQHTAVLLLLFAVRDIHDEQCHIVLHFDTGGFLFVQCSPQEGGVQLQGLGNRGDLFLIGMDHIHPTSRLQPRDGADLVVFAFEIGDHSFNAPLKAQAR